MDAKFEALFTPEPNTGCWLWFGYRQNGYGRIMRGSRQHLLAHRYSYETNVGPIPDGLDVLHRCDVSECVNPEHLFLGTHADNMRDMALKGRQRGPKGEAHHDAKLTREAVDEIRRRYAQGDVTQQELAAEYDVDQTNISYIILGRSWK